jgi:hypothetical protein
MPSPSSLAAKAVPAVWRRVPWKTVWTVSVWLATKGRDRVQRNLDAGEQREFWDLTRKSRGKPNNLSKRDRERIKAIAGKAIRGG